MSSHKLVQTGGVCVLGSGKFPGTAYSAFDKIDKFSSALTQHAVKLNKSIQ